MTVTHDEAARWTAGIRAIDSHVFRSAIQESAMRIPEPDRDGWFGPMIKRLGHMQLESPIEAVFAIWWMFREYAQPKLKTDLDLVAQLPTCLGGQSLRFDFAVHPHTRDDAAAQHALSNGLVVVVELDGHAFHERTKEQVRARNHRDRIIQTVDFGICHFSGSEVVADPEGCVDAVVALAERRGLLDYARAVRPRSGDGNAS